VQPRKVSDGRATILVAEDNDNNYLLFKSILQNDYQLYHAKDGVEAVEMFQLHQPDLILMDINMPRMDGNEATREIRKISDTIPIVAVTAYAFASDKERIMENGFNEYVSKPINVKRLREVVKNMLEKRK
jgi:CheY-like chemotaxis protein